MGVCIGVEDFPLWALIRQCLSLSVLSMLVFQSRRGGDEGKRPHVSVQVCANFDVNRPFRVVGYMVFRNCPVYCA